MMPEIAPIVTVDHRLGELLDDISVDYPLLVETMRARGFSDEQISKTEICISDTVPSSKKRRESGSGASTGSYDKLAREIKLYPRESVEAATGNTLDESLEGYLHTVSADDLSEDFSKALVHELEHHAIEALEGGMIPSREEYVAMGKYTLKAVVVGASLFEATDRAWDAITQTMNYDPGSHANTLAVIASLAVTAAGLIKLVGRREPTYTEYRASPEEIKCREAEENAPSNLVTIRPKTPINASDAQVEPVFN